MTDLHDIIDAKDRHIADLRRERDEALALLVVSEAQVERLLKHAERLHAEHRETFERWAASAAKIGDING